MKALSIKQPWAYLIASGIKDIENRTWKTHFRGRIYIHVSAKRANFWFSPQSSIVHDELNKIKLNDYKLTTGLFSAIIGEVDIIDCVINHPSIWAESTATTQDGKEIVEKPIYNWVLANPVLYEKPILNVKGKLSFWEPDTDIVECIGCSQKFDSEFMNEDSAGEKYCKECEEILFPVMKKDYDEMVAKGEIEPNNH